MDSLAIECRERVFSLAVALTADAPERGRLIEVMRTGYRRLSLVVVWVLYKSRFDRDHVVEACKPKPPLASNARMSQR